MPLDLKDWIAVATGVIGLAASALATVRYFVKKEQLEGDNARLRQRYDELDTHYRDALQVVGAIKAAGTAALLVKSDIDAQLELATKALQARASSVLVALPAKQPADLVFLAVLGPVAHTLRRSVVPIHKGVAGYVYQQGKPYLAGDAHNDRQFFKGIDVISSYTTTDILCVPIFSSNRVIGVLQFLNKDGEPFNQQDLQIAERYARSLCERVAEFLAEPQNFELMGFSAQEQTKEGTILFCDLTASSLLLDTLDFASAIGLINSYLERSCDIAMRHGATVDKFIGDGAMLRFNLPRRVSDYKLQSIRAAFKMRDEFEHQKADWLKAGMPVTPLFTRIGLASGPLHEATMGHPQYQSLTVVGEPVILASNLCSCAPRDRSVILSDQQTLAGLERHVNSRALSQGLLKRIKGQQHIAYELISCSQAETTGAPNPSIYSNSL